MKISVVFSVLLFGALVSVTKVNARPNDHELDPATDSDVRHEERGVERRREGSSTRHTKRHSRQIQKSRLDNYTPKSCYSKSEIILIIQEQIKLYEENQRKELDKKVIEELAKELVALGKESLIESLIKSLTESVKETVRESVKESVKESFNTFLGPNVLSQENCLSNFSPLCQLFNMWNNYNSTKNRFGFNNIWGVIDNTGNANNSEEDYGTRPISLKPVDLTNILVGRPVPPVEHGSKQAGLSTTAAPAEKEIQSTCEAAILFCCRLNANEHKPCFEQYGCVETYNTRRACTNQAIQYAVNQFAKMYGFKTSQVRRQ